MQVLVFARFAASLYKPPFLPIKIVYGLFAFAKKNISKAIGIKKYKNWKFFELESLWCGLNSLVGLQKRSQRKWILQAFWTSFSESSHAHFYKIWQFFDDNVRSTKNHLAKCGICLQTPNMFWRTTEIIYRSVKRVLSIHT